MPPLKLYEYSGCGTCRKASKFLDTLGIDYKEIPIRETPPSKAELKRMLAAYDGEIRRLFNTSGQDYRKLGIKDKLPEMTDTQAIDLLSKNGNLIKRPFVLGKNSGEDIALVGFKEDVWREVLD